MLGIIVAKRIFSGEIEFIIVTLLLLCGITAYFIYCKMYKPLIIILSLFLLGNGFYYIGESSFNVKNYSGAVAVVGRVSDDMQINSYSTQVVLEDVTINGEKSKNIRIVVAGTPESGLNVGDYVAFESEVEKVKPFYLKQFNSKDYRAGVRYYSSVKYENMVFASGSKKLDEIIRLDIKELIFKNMSEDNAGIAYAVMFGDKSGLDGEIYTTYKNSGIIHVLTVSGLHVGFLVSLFYGLMKKCGVNKVANLIISSIVILIYTYLCNFSPSVVRAGVMSICFMFARAINRRYDSLNALGLAGFILCIFKPLTALDIGFLMSFFCVYAILMINPILTKFFEIFLPDKIASLISLSTSAQLGILPFIAYMGGTINLLSFAVNIIVVPIFGLLYPYLFVVGMLGTFMPFLGILLKAVDFALMIINKISNFFSFSNLTIPLSEMGFAIVIAFFFLLFFVGRYLMANAVKKLALFTASFMVIVFALCCYAIPINSSATSVSYINSYNQMSVVLTSSSGLNVVVGQNGLLKRYQNKYIKGDFDIYFSYDNLSDENASDLSEFGFTRFFTCSSDNGGGNSEVLEVNKGYELAGVQFSYIANDDEVLGIIFILDNQRIFVANSSDLDYTLYENILSLYQPKIVIAGTNSQLTQGQNYTCVTYSCVAGSDYSYQNEGNLKLSFNGERWVKRSLD